MKIINGEEIANEILQELKGEITLLEKKPTLAAIFVGENDASELFLGKKQNKCREIEIKFEVYKFSIIDSEENIIKKINELNQDENVTGIIVQLPLPKRFNKKKILDSVLVKKDVDVLNSRNYEMVSPLVMAVEKIFERYNVELKGKNLTVVGYGDLVGKPISKVLMKKMPTLTVCTKYTENLKKHTENADIIITGAGSPGIITREMVKQGAILIDAGISKKEEKIYGDIDFENVKDKANLITPVPGGLGPIMVAMLLERTLTLFLKQNGK